MLYYYQHIAALVSQSSTIFFSWKSRTKWQRWKPLSFSTEVFNTTIIRKTQNLFSFLFLHFFFKERIHNTIIENMTLLCMGKESLKWGFILWLVCKWVMLVFMYLTFQSLSLKDKSFGRWSLIGQQIEICYSQVTLECIPGE